MAVLLDTNVLARLANSSDSLYPVATKAVIDLHRRGEILHITPQNLIEFRSVATRPQSVNGLGLSIPEVEAKAAAFEATFPMLPDTPEIFLKWKAIVGAAGIVGKQVHDARLVAVAVAHDVGRLLTFNTAHFARLATVMPEVVVLDPALV